MAVDEEKAHLLEKLLKSKNPDDLQAANRLIKSLVRSETLKIEKVHKRSEDLETSSTNARVLQDMLEQLSQNQFNKMPGNNEQDNQDFTLMKDIYKTLLKMRPILFRYAGEAAENNEEILSEILSINDQLNRTLDRYEEYAKNKIDGKFTTSNQHNSSDILITLDNGFANSNNCLLEEPTTSTSNDDVAILSLRSNPNSPSIQRRYPVVKPSGNIKNDQIAEESTLRKIRLNGDDINAELTELNLNQEPVIIAKHDIDNLQKSKDQFLLEDVSLSLDNLIINSQEPVIFINQTFIKGVIYFAKNIAIGYKNIIFTVATLTSFNPLPITNIKLKMCSNSSLVSSKLLSTSQTNLKGFHPVAAPENISQVFMLLPLSDTVKQAEISFELLFKSNLGERIEGNFLLKWE
uniref:GAT domain-containing protein n=1 Tax=Acrobeloides nanus TaxID=290746 RepID=A0A914C5N7_9BILA